MVHPVTPLEERITSGDLVAALLARAPRTGANSAEWPGLTIYRFTGPVSPTWEEVQSLSLCVVAQGRKCVTVDGVHYHYDPFNYLVLNSSLHFTAEIIEASVEKPFVSFVLQIDPTLVRKVSVDMLEERTLAVAAQRGADDAEPVFVSALDTGLMSAVLRFLGAISTGPDRRVLAPAYLQEMVYRVLQDNQYTRMLKIAAEQEHSDPIARIVNYVREHLAEPLTVADLAEQVALSTSALSAQFREATGRSPYQFIKDMRLNRARELLVNRDVTVASISREVGYPNPSHFINEFRNRFGLSPRAYCDFTALRNEIGSHRVEHVH
jgi:AraC-like DNA-binding protein